MGVCNALGERERECDIKGGRLATPRSTSPSLPALKGETMMLSWGANLAVLIAVCSAAVGWGLPTDFEDRVLDYLRNGYSRSQRTTDDMFLR